MIVSEDIETMEETPVLRNDGDASFYRRIGKRTFDILLSLALLPLLLPVIIVLWVIISSDGVNGIFGHKRVGQNGRVFRCWKLRTMVPDADSALRTHLAVDPEAAAEWTHNFKLNEDPRITRLGRFLRRTSLDELPQVFNVLMGQMSFVGPRPVVRSELHKYGDKRWIYKSMTPGITGLWQVSGRNDLTYLERVELDVAYSSTVSMVSDIRLIALTFVSVVSATGR